MNKTGNTHNDGAREKRLICVNTRPAVDHCLGLTV